MGALVVLPALLGACAQPAKDELLHGGLVPVGDHSAPRGPDPASDPSALAEQATEDVSAYWRVTYPEVYGGDFEELAGFYPYGPNTDPPPCGNPPPSYEEIADNAFYCDGDDIIAWDEASFIPYMNETFGSFTVPIVIAHEFGHAIQARAGAVDRTVDLELQADCFAGAWTAWVADGDAPAFTPDDVDLDSAVAGMTAIRDAPGTSPDEAFAHGSAFDRVTAFQDGFENSAEGCSTYDDPDVDRDTVELPFDPSDDTNGVEGGNMVLEDGPDAPDGIGLLTRLVTDLNLFYGEVFTELGDEWVPVDDLVLVDPDEDSIECDGERLSGDELELHGLYCADENVVVLDGGTLVHELSAIGDFAVGAEVARLWAQAAQVQLGVSDDDQAGLQADCLTGVWSISLSDPESTPDSDLSTSPGDLDEAIQGIVAFANLNDEQVGTAFERTDALRTGYREGYHGCEDYAPLG
ncbi:MAG TPA: neutral zinc metallopeptidase [Acidimicrobiales bacterium]